MLTIEKRNTVIEWAKVNTNDDIYWVEYTDKAIDDNCECADCWSKTALIDAYNDELCNIKLVGIATYRYTQDDDDNDFIELTDTELKYLGLIK